MARPPRAEPLALRRAALLVEYDGTAFEGFQRQREARTVQGALEEAAEKVGSHAPRLICAGRTDAGVHAAGQVVALSLPERLPADKLAFAMNSVLPQDIRVRRAVPCGEEFGPRHDAVMRTYRYRVCVGVPVPPVARGFVAYVGRVPAPELLAEAAPLYLGKREFREWRAAQCQGKRTLLTISRAEVRTPEETGEAWHDFVFSARSFLQHMVRFLVGGCISVARRKVAMEELALALAEGRRPRDIAPAEARGLILERVDYPPEKDPFR
ncbi:MAG: tRNA pseudouridine(38-40) synthase TruA [Candidatus Sumerlaeia bacterium]|nr:tRNA pseudouridine(38-40) synthase TruA [Candidatus Sumerlaeia bacterium]